MLKCVDLSDCNLGGDPLTCIDCRLLPAMNEASSGAPVGGDYM